MNVKQQTYIILVCLLSLSAVVFAQGPNSTGTYYRQAHGKHGKELKTAFYEIIKNPSVVHYDSLWKAYTYTDMNPEGYVWDMYSNITRYEDPTDKDMHKNSYEGSGLNREHSFPKSWFNSVKPAYSDIVHVIPADGNINVQRSNWPYGTTNADGPKDFRSANDFSKRGACTYPGYSGTVFEPDDEYKGDFARIYFYMATCYEPLIEDWSCDMLGGTSYQPYADWAYHMLMDWAKMDPVSKKEQLRNDAIWQMQGNRNPFVDYPGLEDYIWGDFSDVDFIYDGTTTEIEPVVATSCDINLNKTTFGVDWAPKNTRNYWERYPLTFEKDGVTVTYNFGTEGQNMYANPTQIRLYKYNTLSFKTEANDMTSIEFNVVKNDNGKEFFPSTGTMDGYKWTGNAREVLFTVTGGNGNVQVSGVHVEVADATGIETIPVEPDNNNEPEAIYGIDGRKYDTLQPGVNIVRMKNGRVVKIFK